MIGGSNRFFTAYPPMPYPSPGEDLYRCVVSTLQDTYRLYTTRDRVLHYTDETLPDPIKIALGFIKSIPAPDMSPWSEGDMYVNRHSRKLDKIGWLGKVVFVMAEPRSMREYFYIIILPREVLSEISNGL